MKPIHLWYKLIGRAIKHHNSKKVFSRKFSCAILKRILLEILERGRSRQESKRPKSNFF